MIFLAAALTSASAASAEQAPQDGSPAPQAYQALLRCREVQHPAARLTCFDEAVAKLEAATRARAVVLVDRAHIKDTRRRLFGLPLPDINLFGGREDSSEEVNSLDGVVSSARQDGDGNWIVSLQDGAVWAQTDGKPVAVAPRAGTRIVVRRAAMGSFMIRFGPQPAVRARRLK